MRGMPYLLPCSDTLWTRLVSSFLCILFCIILPPCLVRADPGDLISGQSRPDVATSFMPHLIFLVPSPNIRRENLTDQSSHLDFSVRKLRSGREVFTGHFPDPSTPLRALAPRIPIAEPLQAALEAEDEYWWSTQADGQDAKSPLAPSPLTSPLTSIPPSSVDSDSDYVWSRPPSPPMSLSTSSLRSPSSSCGAPAASPPCPSSPSAADTSSTKPRRKRKKTARDRNARKIRRREERRNAPPTARAPHPHLVKLHEATPDVLEAALAILKGMPVTSTVYTGKRVPALKEGQVWTREELDEAGFDEFYWDGWCVAQYY